MIVLPDATFTPEYKLPALPTTFVGRCDELTEIARLLTQPACRLLTLVGPGGIGKTRLALEVMRLHHDAFLDGACFVPLQPLNSHEFIVSATAASLQVPLSPNRDLFEQLLEYLREKSLLLVIDNFEHLLDGVHFLSDILIHAPLVKILTTSRERLNLIEEWVYDVGGLSFPTSESETDIEIYGAVQLFVQNARRVHNSFALTHAHKPAVSRICRLVGGMPLGIELSSAWVRALPCEVIADEIQRSLDILETPARNILPRHRNMRAAFEPTWNRLSEEEQSVFKKLSVFRGGFTREAAEFVTGASLRILSALADRSLVRLDAKGRYDLHELLRQYAEEHLRQSPEENEAVLDLHSTYYMEFVHHCDDLLGFHGNQKEALRGMEVEIDNARLAWQRAVEQGRLTEIERAYEGFWAFFA